MRDRSKVQRETRTEVTIMHWKIKAAAQNIIHMLPPALSYETYYWVQRHLGRLKAISPVDCLSGGVRMWEGIQSLGQDPRGKVFFEVGTGRSPVMPIAFWLMGADRVISIDLNPYLKSEIVAEDLRYIRDNQPEIQAVFGALLDNVRFARLLEFAEGSRIDTEQLLRDCSIEYIAPGDAADTRLPAQSVDYHVSFNTFEHIPQNVLSAILREGSRIIRQNGLFLHSIDYSDHFAHTDQSISYVNFLQYSDVAWASYSGNRYMFHNRLRHDDFINLFQQAGHQLMKVETKIDRRSQELLSRGDLLLDAKFQGRPIETLATSSAVIISQARIN